MKKQKRITLVGEELWGTTKTGNINSEHTNLVKLDHLLKKGWVVAHMCPFSECTAVSGPANKHERGRFGVFLILEKEITQKKETTPEE